MSLTVSSLIKVGIEVYESSALAHSSTEDMNTNAPIGGPRHETVVGVSALLHYRTLVSVNAIIRFGPRMFYHYQSDERVLEATHSSLVSRGSGIQCVFYWQSLGMYVLTATEWSYLQLIYPAYPEALHLLRSTSGISIANHHLC